MSDIEFVEPGMPDAPKPQEPVAPKPKQTLPYIAYNIEPDEGYIVAPGSVTTKDERREFFTERGTARKEAYKDTEKREAIRKEVEEDRQRLNMQDQEQTASWDTDDMAKLIDSFKELAQVLQHENRPYGVIPFRPKNLAENFEKIDFGRLVRSGLGIGDDVRVDLMCSGFSVQLKDFKAGSKFNLIAALTRSRNTVGFNTRGILFSTDDVHITTLIIDFILEHVTACTVKDWSIAKLRRWIKVTDLPWLMAGALESLYPKGYPLIRECAFTYDKAKPCDFKILPNAARLEQGYKLAFRRTTLFDNSRFTPMHRKQIASDWDALSEADLVTYQEKLQSHNNIKDLIGPINDHGDIQTYLEGQIPSYELYRSEGREWLDSVVAMVNTTLELDSEMSAADTETLRATRLTEAVNTLGAQRIAPWIRAVIVKHPQFERRDDNRTEVMSALEDLSARSDLKANVLEQVEAYKAKQQHSFVGLPNYICPKCKQEQRTDIDTPYGYIPFNITAYFFVIMVMSHTLRS